MRRRFYSWAAVSVLVGAFGLLVVISLMSGRARGAHRIVMERWSETVGTPEEVFERFPPRETNDPARMLIDAAIELGIDIAPRQEENLPRPTPAQAKQFKTFRAMSSKWLGRQIGKSSGPPDAPPETVVEFLSEKREALDRVRHVLLEEDPPAWTSDLTLLHSSPIPNLLGHIDATKLLIIDCLASAHSGDVQRAERSLEAAWMLSRSLAETPTLIEQLVRMSMVRMQAVAVRYLPHLEHWIPRLDGSNHRERLEQTLLLEGWVWPQWDFSPSNRDNIVDRVTSVVSGPYMKLSSVDASERWRRTIVRLGEADAWCEPQLAREGLHLNIPMPWWNRFGEMLVPEVRNAVLRLAHLQLQLELSRKLLELDAERRHNGRWPTVTAGGWSSSVCPGDRWIYSVDGDVATVSLSREPEESDFPRSPAAWSFSLGGSTAAANPR